MNLDKTEDVSSSSESKLDSKSVVVKTEVTDIKTLNQTFESGESDNNDLKDSKEKLTETEAETEKSDDVDTLKCDNSLSEQEDPLPVERVSKVPERLLFICSCMGETSSSLTQKPAFCKKRGRGRPAFSKF